MQVGPPGEKGRKKKRPASPRSLRAEGRAGGRRRSPSQGGAAAEREERERIVQRNAQPRGGGPAMAPVPGVGRAEAVGESGRSGLWAVTAAAQALWPGALCSRSGRRLGAAPSRRCASRGQNPPAAAGAQPFDLAPPDPALGPATHLFLNVGRPARPREWPLREALRVWDSSLTLISNNLRTRPADVPFLVLLQLGTCLDVQKDRPPSAQRW